MGEAAERDDDQQLDDLLTSEEVCAWLKLSQRALDNAIQRGGIPRSLIVMIGRRRRFKRREMVAWFRDKQAQQKQE